MRHEHDLRFGRPSLPPADSHDERVALIDREIVVERDNDNGFHVTGQHVRLEYDEVLAAIPATKADAPAHDEYIASFGASHEVARAIPQSHDPVRDVRAYARPRRVVGTRHARRDRE